MADKSGIKNYFCYHFVSNREILYNIADLNYASTKNY